MSSSTAEGLREALVLRDAEAERLRGELGEAARGATSLARERDEERTAAAAVAAAAAAQEQERLLEQGKRLQAEFAVREARAAKEQRAAVREAEREAERRTAERMGEVAERVEAATEAEAATAKKQLRALSKYEKRMSRVNRGGQKYQTLTVCSLAWSFSISPGAPYSFRSRWCLSANLIWPSSSLGPAPCIPLGAPNNGRRVVHLESAKKESEEAFERELAQSKAALVAVEQK